MCVGLRYVYGKGGCFGETGAGGNETDGTTLKSIKLMDFRASSLWRKTKWKTFERLNNSVLSLPSTLSAVRWLLVSRLYQISYSSVEAQVELGPCRGRGMFLINSAQLAPMGGTRVHFSSITCHQQGTSPINPRRGKCCVSAGGEAQC